MEQFIELLRDGAKATDVPVDVFSQSVIHSPREALQHIAEAHQEIKYVLQALPDEPRKTDDEWSSLRRELQEADESLQTARNAVAYGIEWLLFRTAEELEKNLTREKPIQINRKAVKHAS